MTGAAFCRSGFMTSPGNRISRGFLGSGRFATSTSARGSMAKDDGTIGDDRPEGANSSGCAGTGGMIGAGFVARGTGPGKTSAPSSGKDAVGPTGWSASGRDHGGICMTTSAAGKGNSAQGGVPQDASP